MPPGAPRRRPTGRARFVITVATPDGAARAIRGLGAWLKKAAPPRARGEVTVAIVSDGRMQALNRSFRGKDYATDVLSFPAVSVGARHASPLDGQDQYLGDIVIASGVASRQAGEAGHSVANELRILALHGLLHLLGYDHETDDGRMVRIEATLRKQAGLDERVSQTAARAQAPKRRRKRQAKAEVRDNRRLR